jgi:arylsulfatase A-like enzyme
MGETKNVLFIVVDQLRADCVAGALAHHVDLPNIRAFAKESVSFQRHFSVANPCGPSRASLLTGQYAMNHRSVRNGTPMRHDTPNIATEMRKAGYLPMLFGYTDSTQDPRVFHPNDPSIKTYEHPMHGFHEMLEMRYEMSHPWRGFLRSHGYAFEDYKSVYHPVSQDGSEPQIDDPAFYKAEHSDTAFLTDRFLETMRGFEGESWFAHLTYIRPHPPLVAPAPYNRMYNPANLPLPSRQNSYANEGEFHPFMKPAMDSYTPVDFVEGFPALEPTDENVQTLRAIYLGLATEVDHHIGRVISYLKESGQYDNTLIVFTADHGEMLGDRHSWGKFSVFDAAYHTPLIIRVPGADAQAGREIDAPTESIDVTPTILDWIGQDIPSAMDGSSLLRIVQSGGKDIGRSYSFSELDFAELGEPSEWQRQLGIAPSEANLCILRDARFTLIEFAADLPPLLFDAQGKGEFENVAERPEFQADLIRMMRKMLRHRMQNMDHTLSTTEVTEIGPVEHPRHRGV